MGNKIAKDKNIIVKGARINNLKNIDVNVPLGKFTVVTGVSGSGKSSLAFDTLYAEGQRRYVESLSSYARQFLGRMPKPECDYIKGLPPAIAIQQKTGTRNPRSTVGTSTEIYDYLRMLFARVGKTISPKSGQEVKRHSVDDVVNMIMSYPKGTRLAVMADISIPEGRTAEQQLDIYIKEGYSRMEHNGEFVDISDVLNSSEPFAPEYWHLLIDRMSVTDDEDERSRLADSIETAYFEGDDECIIKVWATPDRVVEHRFSTRFEADGMEFRVPDDGMFNFNSPQGACPTCEGFGKVMGISEDLVIPDPGKSVYEDCVQCFRGEKMGEWKTHLVRLAQKYDFPIHTPYMKLTQAQKDFLWHGKGQWEGIDGFFRWVDENQYKIQYRVMKARYRGKTVCPDCGGGRLRPDALYVQVGGKNISELTSMPVGKLLPFFEQLQLNEHDAQIADRLLREIRSRLEFLCRVGLEYLTLDRLSNTLSGGESQRINLATSMGSALVGSLYVLDEPSIGLHSRDTEKLISVLRGLQQLGNSVVVVEHDEEIMRAADHIIDIGRDAGSLGGNLVFEGEMADVELQRNKDSGSYTLDYLNGRIGISVPGHRKKWKKSITVEGATANNLKNIDVKFPLGVMTVVTGVSGSGKSTLVREILYKSLERALGNACDAPGQHRRLSGDIAEIDSVEMVDQTSIGTSSRSNPATYLKAWDEIRRLYSDQQLSKQMAYTPAYFSFNAEGGRCDECKGEGTVTIPMQFMADMVVPCEACGGKRFKKEILEVLYRGKSIYDILEMTVEEAWNFFKESDGLTEKKIVKRLQPLIDVGLGYVKVGQPSSTLSGGENQRVKLAFHLSQERKGHTLFIFDEPTTGLHFNDISTLLTSLGHLVERGHTVLIIEHNLDVIKCADYVIDIGPEGGEEGGNLVVAGTPEQVSECETSYTGKFLREKLCKY